MSMNKRALILAAVEDIVADFMYYDRKEDEELPAGVIEQAVKSGEVTTDVIVAVFRDNLERSIG